jgi:xanthine dehydrogenase molybdopterin-binding subunit B
LPHADRHRFRAGPHDDIPDNLAGRVTLSRGDVAAALAAAPRRARLSLSIGRAGGQPMETRGLVAEYNAMAGLLTVWAATQAPHQVRQFIWEVLGLEPHRVRVIAPDVGGGFGNKLIRNFEGGRVSALYDSSIARKDRTQGVEAPRRGVLILSGDRGAEPCLFTPLQRRLKSVLSRMSDNSLLKKLNDSL